VRGAFPPARAQPARTAANISREHFERDWPQGPHQACRTVVAIAQRSDKRERVRGVRRGFQTVPADNDRARPLARVKTQQEICEAEDDACAPAVAPANGFWKGMVRSMREGVAVYHEQRATRGRQLTSVRRRTSLSNSEAGLADRFLRFRCGDCRTAAITWGGDILKARRIAKHHPYRRVIARAFHPARVSVDAGVLQALRQCRTQQNVVETQAAIAPPTVPLVIPEREYRLFRMEGANGVDPALQ
jgi:hypothetical protein